MYGWAARSRRQIDDLLVYAKETRYNGSRLIDRPDVRLKLTERAIEAEYRDRLGEAAFAGLEAALARLAGSD